MKHIRLHFKYYILSLILSFLCLSAIVFFSACRSDSDENKNSDSSTEQGNNFGNGTEQGGNFGDGTEQGSNNNELEVNFTAQEFYIDYTTSPATVTRTVASSFDNIQLANAFTVSADCSWRLYKDELGIDELRLKNMPLEYGHNTAYVMIFYKNDYDKYTVFKVDIYRITPFSYTFLVDGETVANETVDELTAVYAPESPVKNYYSFSGWELNGDIANFPVSITENLTFIARFTPTPYAITYDLNGGTIKAQNPDIYDIEAKTIILANPVRENYTFMGWYNQDGQLVEKIPNGSHGNIELTAKWQYGTKGLQFTLFLNEYTVTGYSGTATNVIIPDTWNNFVVKYISNSVFSDCSSLKSITIGDFVTFIGSYTFRNCTALERVMIGNSVTSIDNYAFENCTALESVMMGNSVTSIGNYAFENCGTLENVMISNGVTSIGNYAFENCTALKSITIGNGVTAIGNNAFGNCSSLESIIVSELNSVYYSVNNCMIEKVTKKLILCCKNSIIPSDGSVISIGNHAFNGCISLKSIVLPNSITSIGGYAFSGCTSLASIVLPNSITSIGYWAFSGCSSLINVIIPNSVASIDQMAFCNCTSLEKVTIGNGVNFIGNYSFLNCNSLKSIAIPSGMSSINVGTFENCTSLTSISIPQSVSSIGQWAFDKCSSLKNVYYCGTAEDWTNITIGNDNSNLTSAARYYYSETEPTLNEEGTSYDGNYWFYENGEIVAWKKQTA